MNNKLQEYLNKFILKADGTCHDVFKINSPTTRLSLGWYNNDGITLTDKGEKKMKEIIKNMRF